MMIINFYLIEFMLLKPKLMSIQLLQCFIVKNLFIFYYTLLSLYNVLHIMFLFSIDEDFIAQCWWFFNTLLLKVVSLYFVWKIKSYGFLSDPNDYLLILGRISILRTMYMSWFRLSVDVMLLFIFVFLFWSLYCLLGSFNFMGKPLNL